MSKVTKTFQFGSHQVTLETGELARQADGAVLVTMGETVVLVTAVAAVSGTAADESHRKHACDGDRAPACE